MKSYTDINQSKKLAEILPIESADMWYPGEDGDDIECGFGDVQQELYTDYGDGHPCWSLAALLSVTRNYCTRFELTLRSNKKYNLFAMTDNYVYHGFNEYPDGIDEPIDVCVALIEKLHKFKTL